jgi:hypothetical protein
MGGDHSPATSPCCAQHTTVTWPSTTTVCRCVRQAFRLAKQASPPPEA